MAESSIQQSNPWADDDRSLGGIRNVLMLAEKTGHLPKVGTATCLLAMAMLQGHQVDQEQLLSDAHLRSPSLKMMALMKTIENRRKQIDKLRFEIEQRLQDKETRDLTHVNVLEKRITDLGKLNSYLQQIVSQKDQLISKLQQPYVGDFIKIEASYKKYVSELFPQLVPVLAEMSTQLDNIEWAANVNMATDGRLDGLLSDISTSVASLQSGFQSVCQLRSTVSQIHIQRVPADNSQ